MNDPHASARKALMTEAWRWAQEHPGEFIPLTTIGRELFGDEVGDQSTREIATQCKRRGWITHTVDWQQMHFTPAGLAQVQDDRFDGS